MFIARQPIFKRDLKVYGYELLFRKEIDTKVYSSISSLSSTAAVLGGLFERGIEQIVGHAKAFVNFDYEFLMSDAIELIDSNVLIIEILETVKIDQSILERITYLRNKGYKIALDDFENDEYSSKAFPYANIVKYDIINTPLDTIERDVKNALKKNKIILAEKVETEEEFNQAKRMGFHLFQGYFFCKPNIIASDTNGKKTSSVVYAHILKEIQKDNFDYDKIVNIIEYDVNLSYRVMKIISNKKNQEQFKSIKNVLVKLGKKEIERWVSVLMLQELTKDKPDELFRLSLIRSKFSEYISQNSKLHEDKEEISMMCLFSLLDVILEMPMEEAINSLPFSSDVKSALLEGKGKYTPLCKLINAYENGDFNNVDRYAREIEIKPSGLSYGYLKAIEWTKEIMELY